VERATESGYLREQYGTTDRLAARIEAHARFSERTDDFFAWALDRLDPRQGDLVLDVGCGTGAYHPELCARGVRAVLGLDPSPAMVAASQRQANAQRLPVISTLGHAEHLPLADAVYVQVMANHVFFFIADQRAALREMRRVLRPSGRVMLVTNAVDHSLRLHELHEQAARTLGYVPTTRVMVRFHLDHLPLVHEVFPTVQRFERPDAFLFPTAESAVRYYATGIVDAIEDPPADGSHRPALEQLVGEKIAQLVSREGFFRVPKTAGCFVG
jgi:ubiquinone/menaquinone biosynthesis C-methylase UbiE